MIRDSGERSFSGCGHPSWGLGLVLSLAAGCAADRASGGRRKPETKVQVSALVIGSATLNAGESAVLLAVLTRPVRDASQNLSIHCEYRPNSGSADATAVWQTSPDGTYRLKVGQTTWQMTVQVKSEYHGHGNMKIEACTFTPKVPCRDDEKKSASTVINP